MIVDVDSHEGRAGYARFLTDGVVRARYRNSTERAEPIEPGKVYKYTIDLWATSNVFKAGHRIRVYTSSNFPRFNRNLNTGEPTLGATKMIKANQTIYHDAERPSAIVLPIIRGSATATGARRGDGGDRVTGITAPSPSPRRPVAPSLCRPVALSLHLSFNQSLFDGGRTEGARRNKLSPLPFFPRFNSMNEASLNRRARS